ncbi:MAG: DUF427 domain-containing protein [Phycisphaerales bacterium]
MPRAKFNGETIADSDKVIELEGNVYFPEESVRVDYLRESEERTSCPWKGDACYYNVVVGDQTAENAAWSYQEPKPKANQIKGHIAFWNGVTIED